MKDLIKESFKEVFNMYNLYILITVMFIFCGWCLYSYLVIFNPLFILLFPLLIVYQNIILKLFFKKEK